MCAAYHCDKHVVKMILEYAQLLSGAYHRYTYGADDRLYKPTHMRHPSALWVQESRPNYEFVRDLLTELFDEYQYRYDKCHKTENMFSAIEKPPSRLPDKGFLPIPQCMPDQYKHADPIIAYRQFYLGEKSRFAKWKHGAVPLWYSTGNLSMDGFTEYLPIAA